MPAGDRWEWFEGRTISGTSLLGATSDCGSAVWTEFVDEDELVNGVSGRSLRHGVVGADGQGWWVSHFELLNSIHQSPKSQRVRADCTLGWLIEEAERRCQARARGGVSP